MSNKPIDLSKERLKALASQGNVGPLLASEIHLVLRDSSDKNSLFNLLQEMELEYPIDVLIKRASKDRTSAQNNTQHQWYRDAEAQGDQKAWEYKAYCKLHFGVPIMRRDSLAYRQKYDLILKGLPYEHKLQLMAEPHPYPVTSAMNVAQKSAFLEEVRKHFEEIGFLLTDPKDWDKTR
jgi:hypothetical protein